MMGGRLLRGLPRYLRHPLTPRQAREILHQRQQGREADFLELVRRAILEVPESPYRILLRYAGCDYEDIARLVHGDGVEAALRALHREGVHLTVDEFKGRRPVARGGLEIEVDPGRLRNPVADPSLWGRTSGSGGGATYVPIGLESIHDRAVNTYLALDARGGARWHNAVWGAPGMAPMLWYSVCGGPAARWFSKLDPGMAGVDARYRWSVRILRWRSRLAGVSLPSLEPVPLDDPRPIALWMASVLRKGEVPHLWGAPSSALRLCRTAAENGIDLTGARFTVTGEPVTESRLAALRDAGAEAVPDYGSAESGGPLAQGCLAPEAPDDVHFFDDLHALIQAEGSGFPTGALLVSTLRRTAPFVLLNVSMGDQAVVVDRRCGCALEALGWRTHLHTIRSYEKVTAGGMTFMDADVIRVLEEVLPRRFGGGPSDYQLVEEETSEGHPRLRLLVAPEVGPIDPGAVADAFLSALAAGSRGARVMALQWRVGGFVHVDRRAPVPTAAGKVLHVDNLSSRVGPSGRAR